MPNEETPGEKPGKLGGAQPRSKDAAKDVVTVFRKRDGEMHRETTINVDLPDEVTKALKKHDLKLKFHNPAIARILVDQSAGMVSTDGCISEPGGPSC